MGDAPTLAVLGKAVSEIYSDEGVTIWLLAPNKMLGDLRPCDVWRVDPDRVLQVLDALASGAFV